MSAGAMLPAADAASAATVDPVASKLRELKEKNSYEGIKKRAMPFVEEIVAEMDRILNAASPGRCLNQFVIIKSLSVDSQDNIQRILEEYLRADDLWPKCKISITTPVASLASFGASNNCKISISLDGTE